MARAPERRPHVVMVSWRGPSHPRRGGAERYTEHALAGLAMRGARVSWLAPSTLSDGPDERPGGFAVVPVGGPRDHVVAAGAWLRRNARDVDLVIDQINGYPMLTPFAFSGPRLVLLHHRAGRIWFGHLPWPAAALGYALEPAVLWAYRRHRAVTVSTDTAEDLRRIGFRDVEVVPNAVEPPSWVARSRSEPPQPPRFVALGRLVPGKRFEHALSAFARVRRAFPAATLTIVGRGSDAYAERLITHAERTPGVDIATGTSEAEKWGVLARATALVATSLREGWGIAVSEAHAVGTPSIAYDVPGLRSSTVHLESGIVCPPTPEAAADAMILLARDPELWARLGGRARHLAGELTPARLQASFAAVVDRTLREASRPGLPTRSDDA